MVAGKKLLRSTEIYISIYMLLHYSTFFHKGLNIVTNMVPIGGYCKKVIIGMSIR